MEDVTKQEKQIAFVNSLKAMDKVKSGEIYTDEETNTKNMIIIDEGEHEEAIECFMVDYGFVAEMMLDRMYNKARGINGDNYTVNIMHEGKKYRIALRDLMENYSPQIINDKKVYPIPVNDWKIVEDENVEEN